jgi:hypothetical protein
MTNPYFGFIAPCNRCGSRMTYALLCKACELRLGWPRAEDVDHEIDNRSLLDARLISDPPPAAGEG